MMTDGDGQLVHMYEYEYLPVKRQLVVLLHKDVERAVIRVPGVAPLLLPPNRRPIQRQVQVRRQREPRGRGRRPLPRPSPLLHPLNVAVAIALHVLLHDATGDEAAHGGAASVLLLLLAPCSPKRRNGTPTRRIGPLARSVSGRCRRYGCRRLGLEGRDEEGAGRVGVAVAEGVEGLAPVPEGITGQAAAGHHTTTTHRLPHPTWDRDPDCRLCT